MSSPAKQRVVVIGAGVIGLTTALRILQSDKIHASVTIISEILPSCCRSSPSATPSPSSTTDTFITSLGAGGLWKPYSLLGTPPDLINKWGKATFDHYLHLYHSPQAATAGVMLTSAYQFWKDTNTHPHPHPHPPWAHIVPHFRDLSPSELATLDPSHSHSYGWFYTTIITDARAYMSWLADNINQLGGKFHQQKILHPIEELTEYDVIVNCTGLGARNLSFTSTSVSKDNSNKVADVDVMPVRGQVVRVKAPWIQHYYNSNGEAYIIPNLDCVVLGGTVGPGDWDVSVRDDEQRGILERCCAIVPSLRNAEVIGGWTGLRPGRVSGVRLKKEEVYIEGGRGMVVVVHNYGAGGAGFTLAWGLAGEVVEMLSSG